MNSNQPKPTLRELARDYAGGRIDRTTFLRRRARLLEELANSKAVKVRAKPTQIPSPPLEQAAPTPKPKTEKRLNKTLVGGVTLVIVIGLAALVVFLPQNKTAVSTDMQQQTSAPLSASDIRETPVDPITKRSLTPALEDAVRHFVETDDWSPQSLTDFITIWSRYSPVEQREIQSSSWFLSLSSELQARIKEEQGLSSSQHSDIVESLVKFGIQLGLDYAPPTAPTKPTPPAKKPVKVQKPKLADATPVALDTPLQQATSKVADSSAKPEIQPKSEAVATPEIRSTLKEPPEKQAIPDIDVNEVQTENTMPVEKTVAALMETTPLQLSTEGEVTTEVSKNKLTATESIEENCRPRVASRRIAKCRDTLTDGTPGPWLRLLPGGMYNMGNAKIDAESPAHKVRISYPLAISTQEVSYEEFAIFCKATGSRCPPQPWEGNQRPVVNVNREDAVRYTQWLNQQTRRAYRLPTEAEWEYAARAGTTGPYPIPESDLGTYAHYSRRAQEAEPLARQPQRTNPNAFGLFHMAGNVREWVLDSWHVGYTGAPSDGRPRKDPDNSLGVVRGGSYADKTSSVRSSAREGLPADTRDSYTGIRLVRDVYVSPSHEDLSRWGDWWLAFQPKDQFTIQLFALNQRDEVNRIISENPKIALKVVTSKDPAFGYRILHGLFESKNTANTAYLKLPDKLKAGGTKLQIKSIGEIR